MAVKLLEGKALTKAIDQLGKDAKSMVARIHLLATAACVEAVKLGHCNAINRLDKVTEHIGRRALRRWMQANGPCKWDTQKNAFVLSPTKRKEAQEKGEAYAKDMAEGKSYAQEAKESDTSPFKGMNIPKLIASIVKRQSELTPEELASDKNDFRGLAELKALETTLKITKPVKISATAEKPAPKTKNGKVRHIVPVTAAATVAEHNITQ